ncbi:hypothetical protein C8R45DRAFT_1109098 [Mycena sanguinolenta]|nr:hypothetical protein C8R45DRAFT_1109098 [Mycena sanguinolenta]
MRNGRNNTEPLLLEFSWLRISVSTVRIDPVFAISLFLVSHAQCLFIPAGVILGGVGVVFKKLSSAKTRKASAALMAFLSIMPIFLAVAAPPFRTRHRACHPRVDLLVAPVINRHRAVQHSDIFPGGVACDSAQIRPRARLEADTARRCRAHPTLRSMPREDARMMLRRGCACSSIAISSGQQALPGSCTADLTPNDAGVLCGTNGACRKRALGWARGKDESAHRFSPVDLRSLPRHPPKPTYRSLRINGSSSRRVPLLECTTRCEYAYLYLEVGEPKRKAEDLATPCSPWHVSMAAGRWDIPLDMIMSSLLIFLSCTAPIVRVSIHLRAPYLTNDAPGLGGATPTRVSAPRCLETMRRACSALDAGRWAWRRVEEMAGGVTEREKRRSAVMLLHNGASSISPSPPSSRCFRPRPVFAQRNRPRRRPQLVIPPP